MGHNRSRMTRLVLTAAHCFSIGSVKGRCYYPRDCPVPQICGPSGACVLQDASATPAIPDAGDGEETGVLADGEADTEPVLSDAGDDEETGSPSR